MNKIIESGRPNLPFTKRPFIIFSQTPYLATGSILYRKKVSECRSRDFLYP